MTEREFIQDWIERAEDEYIPGFPDVYLEGVNTTQLKLPSASMALGSEMFGSYELINTDGNVCMQVDSYVKAKYILYANRKKPKEISVPVDEDELNKIVKSYEKEIDTLLKEILTEYNSIFNSSSNSMDVSTKIFKSLNLSRY